MNRAIATLLGAVLLTLGVIAGAAMFVVLLLVGATVWLAFKARMWWARWTGKPVPTWSVGGLAARQGFMRTYGSFRSTAATHGSAAPHAPRTIDDVTDVEPRTPAAER
ncbi:hypothetical protein [Lampropedia cohaerens]|uniref:hypothetical protein n=1 Tax=Lampropedia cohaerens TaxID=1610491 RepID=UPI0012E39DE7|nr:hypothetical protein [Lampropedia cohaerens]